GAVQLSGSGQDAHRSFDSKNTKSVYASCLVNVSSASSSGEYFMHLGPSNLGTTFRGRVYVKSSDDGIQFGVSKSSTGPNYAAALFKLNKTYQLVLKYSFLNTSNLDDLAEIFVLENPSDIELTPLAKAPFGETDSPNIGSLALRQGSSSRAANLRIDEIKVATSWEEATSLSRSQNLSLILPESLYAFKSNCQKEAMFEVNLKAFWPEQSLNVRSPSVDVVQFSKNKKDWFSQMTFTSEDNNFFEVFYLKMLPSSLKEINGSVLFKVENIESEELVEYQKAYQVYSLRNNCTMSVQDIKRLSQGDSVKIAGRISASANEFPAFNYVQDETGGIRLQGDFGFNIGDSVHFYGLISELNQELVLNWDSQNPIELYDNKAISGQTILLSELANYTGQLVRVENVSLQDQNFVFLPNTNERVEQGGRVITTRIWSKTKLDGHGKPQDVFDMTAVVGQFRDQFQLYPRKETDIENLGEIPFSTLNISKEYTFDIAAWNLEWFGSAGNGPLDDELQLENASKVLKETDADVYVLEEISNISSLNALVDRLDNYAGVCSPAVSGGGKPENAQRICFVYKRSTVKMVDIRPLLAKTLPISGYPNTFDRFWASGRLPALFVCDVSIDGVERRLHIVGIHARANRNNPDEREEVYNMRKIDVQVLKDSLDRYFSLASIIMAGDFNDDVDETVVSGLTESTYANFANDNKWGIPSGELSKKGEKSFIGFDNVIDHIVISDELFESIIPEGTELLLPFVEIDEYPDNTSDHLPITGRFMLKSVLTATEFNELDSVVIYPNPTEGDLKIGLFEDQKVNAILYTLQGLEIANVYGKKTNLEKKISKKLSKEAAGVYILKLLIGNAGKTYKIIKQ
ncbi:MAG: hypothetical protein ACI9K1_001290, partial [Arcticibacterium sp.]